MAELNDGRVDLRRSRARFIAFSVAAMLIFTALGGRLFQLQVVSGEEYARRAAADRTVEVPVPAPRGLIFDRAGRPLAVNTPSWTVKVRPADLPEGERRRVISRVARLTGFRASILHDRLDAFQGSPFDLVPILRGVEREAALIIGEESETLPGVVVEVDPVRQYLDETGAPNGTLLSHLVGYTGPVSRDELVRLQAEGYLRDDVLGKAGVEASFEDELRGRYGARLVELGVICLPRPPGTTVCLGR